MKNQAGNEMTPDPESKSSGNTVSISTTRFGDVEVSEQLLIEFPNGLIGFETFTRYVILENKTPGPFKWLQCVDEPDLAFVVTEPEAFFENYDVPVTEDVLSRIELTDVGAGVLLALVTTSRKSASVTVNLQGPILFNPEKQLACQLALQTSEYGTQHPIPLEGPLEEETKDQKNITLEEEAC